ncbi:hypothetical protein HV144_13090 [Citrobacter freundii]|nr:hypothetical protein [Citrobacter freundii]
MTGRYTPVHPDDDGSDVTPVDPDDRGRNSDEQRRRVTLRSATAAAT